MLIYNNPENPSTLECTSDFQHEAFVAAQSNGTILDCGASSHFSPEKSKFLNYQEINPEPVKAADGRTFKATGKGDLKINLPNGDQKPTPVTLKNVYYSPNLAFTLISVGTLDRLGYTLYIKAGVCIIRSPKNTMIAQIPLIRGLYRVTNVPKPLKSPVATAASKLMSINELHRKMGHVNYDDLRKMVKDGMVVGIDLDFNSKPDFCEACIKAKATRKPFPKRSETKYLNYGDKVVADTWGPAKVESLGGKKYYHLFQDLASHEERVYFSRKKSEGFESYKTYEAWVNTQRGAKIRVFGSDRRGEFTSQIFDEHLEKKGTVRHLTVHDSPSSNGSAERANRTHLECAVAMLVSSGLPKSLWGEAVLHSVWIRNRVPTRSTDEDITPYEKGTGKKPNLSMLHE